MDDRTLKVNSTAFRKLTRISKSTSHTTQSEVMQLWTSLGVEAARERKHGFRSFHVYKWNELKESHIFHVVFVFVVWADLTITINWMFSWNVWTSVVPPCSKFVGQNQYFYQTKNSVWHRHCLNAVLLITAVRNITHQLLKVFTPPRNKFTQS